MFDKIKFAHILRNISQTYNNQREFSQKSGINRTYISQYINMKLDEPPKPKILEKLANASSNTTSYHELMQVCGYIYETKLTPGSYGIEDEYWKMIFGNATEIELSQKGSEFFSSFFNEMIERANKCQTDDDCFEINFASDLVFPETNSIEEFLEYNKIVSFIICSLISNDTLSITSSEKKDLLNIVQRNLNNNFFIEKNKNLNLVESEKIKNNDFRYASFDGTYLDVTGLSEEEIEELKEFVEFAKKKKKLKEEMEKKTKDD